MAPGILGSNPPVFHSGDILAFYGRERMSRFISVMTGKLTLRFPFWEMGPSHVAIVAGLPIDVTIAAGPRPQMVLWESTTLCDLPDMLTGNCVKGVQVHPIMDRVRSYPGTVFHLPLMPSWNLNHDEWRTLTRFLNHHKGGMYDYSGAGLSGTRALKFLRNRYPDPHSMFCSELCCAGLMRVNRYDNGVNPSTVNPANLVRDCRASGRYAATMRQLSP